MSDATDYLDSLEADQCGLRYRSNEHQAEMGRFKNRGILTRDFVRWVMGKGKPRPDKCAIDEMLALLDRDYGVGRFQIYQALGPLFRSGEIDRLPNGNPVIIDGHQYSSARAAAKEKQVAPQTVLNRIASSNPKWAGWGRAVTNVVE